MAAYKVSVKLVRGTPTDAIAELETFLETLDSTNNPVVNLSCVGDNNFVTYLLIYTIP